MDFTSDLKKELRKLSAGEEILTLNFLKGGRNKQLHLMAGDICDITEPVDLVVCSAFKNDYSLSYRTLIKALYDKKDICVEDLSLKPAIDLRNMGCWISEETGNNFSRIACVEILSFDTIGFRNEAMEKLLTSTFSTLRFLCEQANFGDIPVRNMVMPILGTGNQNININYVAPALFSQMRLALECIDQLTDIYIYERKPEKALQLSEILSGILENSGGDAPDIFISYSSRQNVLAHDICTAMTNIGISCWIAPESIPAGSDYIDKISEGLGTTQLTVLVLTPDAERSRWVKKEVGASIGAGHIVIPYQKEPYIIGNDFRFLLEGEQIFEAWKEKGDSLSALVNCVYQKLNRIKSNKEWESDIIRKNDKEVY